MTERRRVSLKMVKDLISPGLYGTQWCLIVIGRKLMACHGAKRRVVLSQAELDDTNRKSLVAILAPRVKRLRVT